MKHAGAGALSALEPLLSSLRALDGLREKSAGTFYRGSSAFLHFHEDPAGLFADLRVRGAWDRHRVSTRAEQRALLRLVRQALNAASR